MDLNSSQQPPHSKPCPYQHDTNFQQETCNKMNKNQSKFPTSASEQQHYLMITLNDQSQISAHQLCSKDQQNHLPYSQDQINSIREIVVYNAIEYIEELEINNLEASEHCIYLLSYLLPYTAPNFKEYSNFIIAFAINQACFPEANLKAPSDLARFIKYNPNDEQEDSIYFQCYSIYSMKVPNFPSLDTYSTSNQQVNNYFEEFDSIHSLLQGLILQNKNELTERLKQENTSFAQILKIIQTVDDLTDNDFTAIQNCIKIYWMHEELFNNYSSEIIAHVILKLLQYSYEVEFDFSKFGNLELLSNVQSHEWIENFKNCFLLFVKIVKTQIPEQVLSQCDTSCQEVLFNFSQLSQFMSSEEMEIEEKDDELMQEENLSMKLNKTQNQILIQNNFSILNNTTQNSIQENTYYYNNLIIQTPEKKNTNQKQFDFSSLSTEPLNRQSKFLNNYTEETKSSSSTYNLCMSIEDTKTFFSQELSSKISPTPFNQQEISTFQNLSEINN